MPELRQHERLQLKPGAGLPFLRAEKDTRAPSCACGGQAVWDGHKYRCHGCGLYIETCCDGGRCS